VFILVAMPDDIDVLSAITSYETVRKENQSLKTGNLRSKKQLFVSHGSQKEIKEICSGKVFV